MQFATLELIALTQYFERWEISFLFLTFLSTVFPFYFHLTYVLEGPYKVLNQLSVHLHQGSTWHQLKECINVGILQIYIFIFQKKKYVVCSKKNNIEAFEEVAEFLLNGSLKDQKDFKTTKE